MVVEAFDLGNIIGRVNWWRGALEIGHGEQQYLKRDRGRTGKENSCFEI